MWFLAMGGAGLWIAFTLLWAFVAQGFVLSVLPVSSVVVGKFFFATFHGAFVFLGLSLLGKIAYAWHQNKKEFSKKNLMALGAFVVGLLLWVFLALSLNSALFPKNIYSSPIKTTPTELFGLTAPVDIEFDAGDLPIDAELYKIINYAWDFGDGSRATGEKVTHRYTSKGAKDGRYTVVLSVELMELETGATLKQEFTVDLGIENESVVAKFSYSPKGAKSPVTLDFDASASMDPDGQIVAYDWDFNRDGRFDDAEGEKVSYEYLQDGAYEVALRVTDNNGEFDVMKETILIGNAGRLQANMETSIPANGRVQVNQNYRFDASDSVSRDGAVTSYVWDFGDGKKIQGKTVNYTFTKIGSYTILLEVKDAAGNVDEETLEIEVREQGAKPVGQITSLPAGSGATLTGTLPFQVEWSALESKDPDDDIVDYRWSFGNSGVPDKEGSSVSSTFDKAGTFVVTLLVEDAEGNTHETTKTVIVKEQGLTAVLKASVNQGEVPLVVSFDASASSYREGDIVSYTWDFGNGSEPYISGSTVNYKYQDVGTYTASVTVLASDGSKDTDSVQIVVRPVALTACFTTNIESGPAPLFVSVDPACSLGTVHSYAWSFGDGNLSFDRKPPTITYLKTGVYTITLEVTGENGVVDTYTKNITVQ